MGEPVVGIVLGSDSDLPLGREAARVLAEFDVPCEVVIASAHRTPEKAGRYAREAAGRGLKVIIAVAGLAAHLPGVLAAQTTLPVIGVPVAAGTLGGIDALLAMAQMPGGVPVATVGIGAAKNAALLAVAVIATAEPGLAARLVQYRKGLAEQVEAKDRRLGGQGWQLEEGQA
ncbi:MAG TPA: 5-(carboxyamino)imidazole ribonucleotide mutase [Firmicutes bacterium]|uniref:5-(carboxyamino)imidazole ribonucleotide mutase n=1 Tax=Gelria sp. Kuro-4 TaxID=2796927 RepID=UPI00199E5E8B|nr:5-(carboxyamino)imidazole ribonucleotide mutase [Gelria sp. Kuro-4]BCV24461.1 N5-carboxyaminoimidazole ribonucleotide mutase [Gelria sp. Kuro-4]HHV57620.1 5-(carboxyamino)imidazole ribonucleotide mutase [Bacillota bacterium]